MVKIKNNYALLKEKGFHVKIDKITSIITGSDKERDEKIRNA